MALSVGGIMSGLDTNSIIDQLSELNRRPIAQLQRREAAFSVKLTTYGSMRGLLNGVKTAAAALSNPKGFEQFNASSSKSDVVSATATGKAITTSHKVVVHQLAQEQRLRSIGFEGNPESNPTVGAGTLHLQVGTAQPTAITIQETDTLQDIARHINASDAGVSASVIFSGDAYHLSLTAREPGMENVISLKVDDSDGDSTDMEGLSRLVYDPDSGVFNMVETQQAQNARIDVDGITGIERSSNTISDIIDGLTLTLKSLPESPGSEAVISVTRSTSAFNEKINAFVSAYNELVDFFKSNTAYNMNTQKAGPLTGDSTTRHIQNLLKRELQRAMPGMPSELSSLFQVGITSDRDGKLKVDSSVLSAAIQNNYSGVVSFFSEDSESLKGFAVSFAKSIEGVLAPRDGILASRTGGIENSISSLQKQMERMESRVMATEERLRAQFLALEELLAGYQTTSSFLSQQIAGLQNLNHQIANRR